MPNGHKEGLHPAFFIAPAPADDQLELVVLAAVELRGPKMG